MSYKSREKKRQYKAREAAITSARNQHPDRYYLTVVKRNCCCNRCARPLRSGDDMVYRREPAEVWCRPCAETARLDMRLSARWERVRTREAEMRRGGVKRN